jgi:hypothetical protein
MRRLIKWVTPIRVLSLINPSRIQSEQFVVSYMKKKSKAGEFEEIEQKIFQAKSEKERKMWELILKRLKDNPPQKPKILESRKS